MMLYINEKRSGLELDQFVLIFGFYRLQDETDAELRERFTDKFGRP